ncbi:MAG: PTS sugar transporter subunit IIA [Halothiobacillaceae bacterium]|nr:PTS sugar transporter subunit IIA [Halothiobacillaceae bacterium]
MKQLTIADILTLERVKLHIDGISKKRVLELVSQVLASAQEGLEAWAIFDVLLARERLGSTGVGRGIAIPHGKLTELRAPIGCFLRLVTPVDFNSPDAQEVSMIFAILVPEGDEDTHLAILGQLARRFSDPEFCSAMRVTDSSETAFSLLTRKLAEPESTD